MLGEIFRSRYQVEALLQETQLFQVYRTHDLLSHRQGLLYVYPYEDRAPLDLSSFRYRHARFRALLGDRAPACQLIEGERALFVLAEPLPAARPLGLRQGDIDPLPLLSRVLRDLQGCRRRGLHLADLSPENIWLLPDGDVLYLPPVLLHFSGFSAQGGKEASALDRHGESGSCSALDLRAFGFLASCLVQGRPEWSAFREGLLPALLLEDPARRPLPAEIAAAPPFDGLPELAELRADCQAPTFAELPDGVQGGLYEALAAYRAGANVLLVVDAGQPGDLEVWRCAFDRWFSLAGKEGLREPDGGWLNSGSDAKAHASFQLISEILSPSALLNPLWSRLGDESRDERFFLVLDAQALAAEPRIAAQVELLLQGHPKLHRSRMTLPEREREDQAERLRDCAPEDRPLLEILALQDEPLVLGLLAQLFPVQEEELFTRIASLEMGGELIWRPGLGVVSGCWGLRAALRDPRWRRSWRRELSQDRRRELHRLCIDLMGADGKSPARALMRLRHLVGAEDWSKAAAEAMSLYTWAEENRRPLLLEEMARLLQTAPIQAELSAAGKQTIYQHLAGRLIHQGQLDEALIVYERALSAVAGNADFLAELLDERSKSPALPELERDALLTALGTLLRGLAELRETRGEFGAGITLLGRFLEAYREELRAHERGLLYNDLAWLLSRRGENEEAVERCEIALRLFDPRTDLLELGQTYNTLGAAKWELNQWADAETYYKRALALREKAGDEIRIAASLNNLGNLYRLLERFPLAIDYFHRSMAIKKRHHNFAGYLISLFNVALINFEMNDLKTSRSQCLECLELNRIVGNVQLGAEINGLLGEIAQVEGRIEEAHEHLEEAIRVCRKIEAHSDLVSVLRRMIPVQLARQDMAGALAAIKEGLQETRRVGNRFEEAQIRVFEADYRLAGRDQEGAVTALEQAADIFSALDKYERLARTYSRLGLLQLERGLEIRARECLQHATDIIEHRKVNAMIPEWDALQMKLQQRQSYYAQRIKGEGKTRLASLYQALNLLTVKGDGEELISQALMLLIDSFSYQRAALCLFEGLDGSPSSDPILLGLGEFPDESEWLARAKDIRAEPRFVADTVAKADGRCQRLFLPLQREGRTLGILGMERGGEACDDEERDFLGGYANLLSLRWTGPAPAAPVARRTPSGPGRADTPPEARLIGESRHMQRLRQVIRKVQDVEATVLITGETGSGKDEVARAVHFGSIRRERPFKAQNCAAIPESLLESYLFGHERGAFTGASHRHIGLFEEADGGTVFLDEIGEMSLGMQTKLLRVLETKEFNRVGGNQVLRCNVRILAASNRDMLADVAAGHFRQDLFYRINVLHIHVPPLREKREDIPLLVEHFLFHAAGKQGGEDKRISPEVMELFVRHPWPGNIRQLQNVLNRCVILSRSPVIQREDLPEDFLEDETNDASSRSLEELADMIIRAGPFSEARPLEEPLLACLTRRLVENVGSKAKAARLLGVSKPTLYRRLKYCDRILGES